MWILVRHFNKIMSLSEKKGGCMSDTHGMLEFQQAILQTGFIDVGFTGNKFTWCNNRRGSYHIYMAIN